MRIAIVETSAFGGLLHYGVQLGDGLAARGHQVDLIVPRGNELADHDGPARMRAVLTPPSRPTDTPPKSGLRRFFKRAGVAVRLTAAWLQVIREARFGGYDVVIVNCDLSRWITALGALVVVGLPGGPATAEIVHNAETVDRTGKGHGPVSSGGMAERILAAVRARVDLSLVHGARSEAIFVETWPYRRVAQIPHGDERIFSAEPPPAGSEERILLFGDWNRVKNIPLLREAFDLLSARRPGVRLTLAGMPQPQEVDVDAIRAWAAGHDGAVELVDRYVPIEEVPAIFGRARVVVAPYVIGYQSGVIHLAMTMARPVVAADVGDFASVVIDGETGLLVPPGDAEKLADALERLLADPELAERLGAGGRAAMEGDSSWEAVAEQAERALEELVPAAAPVAASKA